MALRSGRAPYCGSKPAFARYWTASSDTSSALGTHSPRDPAEQQPRDLHELISE
jgi:hypothetical protein